MKEIEDILRSLGCHFHKSLENRTLTVYVVLCKDESESFLVTYNKKKRVSLLAFMFTTETGVETSNIRGSILANI
tara:strand:+ start:262 stop:486 length:225 start_codon:yes stop_codon:yes gene_type:complete